MSNFIKIPGTILCIDWADIDKRIKCIAIDRDGKMHGFPSKPVKANGFYSHPIGHQYKELLFFYGNPYSNWEDACFERPTVSEQEQIQTAYEAITQRESNKERRERIAAQILSGMMGIDFPFGADKAAQAALKYTDALIQELDKPQ